MSAQWGSRLTSFDEFYWPPLVKCDELGQSQFMLWVVFGQALPCQQDSMAALKRIDLEEKFAVLLEFEYELSLQSAIPILNTIRSS